MFRNFVKPAALDRDSMRERQRLNERVCSQVLYENDEEFEEPSQASHRSISDRSDIYAAPSASAGNTETRYEKKESFTRKSGYTTSIYVNGGGDSVAMRPPKLSQNQSFEHTAKHGQSNGSLRSLPRSASLPNNNQNVSTHTDHRIQQRLSDICLSDRNRPRSENGVLHSSKTSSDSQQQVQRNGSVDSTSTRRSSAADFRPDFSKTWNFGDDVKEASRRSSFSQMTFNVVPPPPPVSEPVFAGRRDVRNPTSVQEKQIVSAKGTVRGFKNRVRAGIATFWAQPKDSIIEVTSLDQPRIARNYRHLEQGKIVIYATSMSVVRETSERCKIVRSLLQNHMVRYEERDLYMSREIQQELRHRLKMEGNTEIHLPHVFADGIHIGGAGELEKLNEAGELRGLLDNYQKITVRIMCEKCGGYRFVPCEVCHGSKRSLLRNHFTEEFCALRCMNCDENGLKRCDLCKDQQE